MIINFGEKQKKYFKKAEEKRFFWQTQNKYITLKEKKLLKKALYNPQNPILEVGAGEGANLYNLELNDLTGVDFSQEKVNFAKSKNTKCNFIVAQAQSLPFNDESFNTVFSRDLLHHLPEDDKIKAVREMWRVLKKSGQLVIIEPNKKNPLVFFQGIIFSQERGLLKSAPKKIQKILLQLNVENLQLEYEEPMPCYRLVFHYNFGLPWLAKFWPMVTIFNIFNSIYRIIIPKKYWAYYIFKIKK